MINLIMKWKTNNKTYKIQDFFFLNNRGCRGGLFSIRGCLDTIAVVRLPTALLEHEARKAKCGVGPF